MAEPIDVYWSFRSPYSYLVTPDVLKLRDDYDVDVNLRVVFPIAVRSKKALFDPSNMKPVQYILMDSFRRAQFLGLPLAFPNPDPVVQNRQTFEVAEDQPLIHRLSKLGVEAQRQGSKWKRPSQTLITWTKSNPIMPRLIKQAIGAFRRWCCAENHSSGKIASRRCAGVSTNMAWKRPDLTFAFHKPKAAS